MANLNGFHEYFDAGDITLLEAAIRKPKPDATDIRKQVEEILKKNKPKDKKGLLIVIEGIDGSGKCFSAGTKVLMYDGSIKKIENIQVGDIVMGNDNTPRTVKSTHSGVDQMYDIIPRKGMTQRVNSKHTLVFKFACKKNFKNLIQDHGYVEMTAPEFLEQSKCFQRYAQLERKAINYPTQPVEIDPYILGVWLGDGTSSNTGFTTCDHEIAQAITEEAESRNLRVTVRSKEGSRALSYKIIGSGAGVRDNTLRNSLRKYQLLNNKHVPECYKINNREVRLQILAGLIDTDGHVSTKAAGYIDFINKNKQLAEDVVYLARSLGLAAYIKPCKKGCQTGAIGDYFRVSISGHCDIIPTRIKRKIIKRRIINKDPLRVGFNVKPAGVETYYGFETDGNHLFLLGDFTVAHNSSQTELLVDWLKEEGYDVVTTKWNSSKVMKDSIKKAKKDRLLSPILYSLLHAADMVLRYENEILPALNDNKIVICDRYIYTSMARDKARGVNIEIMNEIYKGFREPDLLFHFALPIHTAFTRMIKEKGLSYYGTGMDLNLADNKEENYVKYGNLLDKYYKQILPMVSSYHKIMTNRDIQTIAQEVREIISKKTGIGRYKK
jgi:thymidylate kinase